MQLILNGRKRALTHAAPRTRKVLKAGRVALILACLSLSTCMTPGLIEYPRKGEDFFLKGDSSVIFWSLRVTVPSSELYENNLPYFELAKAGEKEFVSAAIFPIVQYSKWDSSVLSGGWKKEKDGITLDVLYCALVQPGSYSCKEVVFDLYHGRPGSGTTYYITVPFDRGMEIAAGKTYYAGVFTINFTKISGTMSNLKYSLKSSIDRGDEGFAKTVEQFQQNFPGPYSRYGQTIARIPNTFRYYADFRRFEWEKHSNYNASLETKSSKDDDSQAISYVLSYPELVFNRPKKDDTLRTETADRDLVLPDSWDLTWRSSLKDAGSDSSLPYGVFIGSDTGNAYYFCATGDGQTGAGVSSNRKFGRPPIGWEKNAVLSVSNSPNLFRVAKRGHRYAIYVNDKESGSFDGTLDSVVWRVGLFISDHQKVAFTNLSIVEK